MPSFMDSSTTRHSTPHAYHRMEITELLSEVRIEGGSASAAPTPSSKKQRALQAFLFALRDLLLGLAPGVRS